MIRFSRALVVFLAAYIAVAWVFYLFVRESPLIDGLSVCLASVAALIFVAHLCVTSGPALPLLLLYAVVCITFYFIRVITLMGFPETFRYIASFSFQIGLADVNRGLAYFALSCLAVCQGIYHGGARSQRLAPAEATDWKAAEFRILFVVCILVAVTQLAANYLMGFGRFAYALQAEHQAVKILLYILLNRDVAVFLACGLCVAAWNRLPFSGRALGLLSIGVLVAVGLLGGSKAGLFFVLMVLLWSLFLREEDPRFPLLRTAVLGLLLAPILLLSYYVGHGARLLEVLGPTRQGQIAIGDVLQSSGKVLDSLLYGESQESLAQGVIERTTALDPLVTIMAADETTQQVASHYFTLANVLKSVINQSSPFKPFPDALWTSRYFNAVYLQESWQDVLDNYGSEVYYFPGICYLHWGVAGGLIMLFFISFAWTRFYCRRARNWSWEYRAIFFYTTYAMYNSNGWDHTIMTGLLAIFHTTLYMTIARGRLSFRSKRHDGGGASLPRWPAPPVAA